MVRARTSFRHALAACSIALACDAVELEPTEDESKPAGKADGASDSLVEGTPNAIGVQRLLESPETTLEVLDHDAALERRAAQNLIAHRNGPDGIYEEGATGSDDDVFGSIAEIDAVSRVGAATLQKLLDFALQNDFVPGANQELGTWDEVDFTVAQAEATLAFANTATQAELQAALHDSRPVQSILDARPLASVLELSQLFFIGPVMMQRLKDVTLPDGSGDACSDTDACPGALACMGPAQDGIGLCVDTTPIPGDGEECSIADDCAPDLVCSGLTIFDVGICRPEWMAGQFPLLGSLGVPSMVMAEPIAMLVTVRGLASVPEDITVELTVDHTDPSSLRIAVRDPNGQESIVWDGPTAAAGPVPSILVAGPEISRDDEVNGEWAVLVQNVGGRGEGSVIDPVLHLTSRFD